MSLQDTMERLASAFRKKFSVTDKLGFEDMIELLSTKSIMIVPSNSFKIPNGLKVAGTNLVKLGATINDGNSSWGQIAGMAVTGDKALAYVNDDKYVVNLHLYITKVENGGEAWLKWSDADGRTTFTPVVGDNLLQLPSADGEGRFSLVLHPFFDSITIDPTKSYIEAVPSN